MSTNGLQFWNWDIAVCYLHYSNKRCLFYVIFFFFFLIPSRDKNLILICYQCVHGNTKVNRIIEIDAFIFKIQQCLEGSDNNGDNISLSILENRKCWILEDNYPSEKKTKSDRTGKKKKKGYKLGVKTVWPEGFSRLHPNIYTVSTLSNDMDPSVLFVSKR